MDESYVPAPIEKRTVYGITFEQGRNDSVIDESLLTNFVTENKTLTESAKRDLLIALITLKYTQSNSVCYAEDGQTIGVGAGQQSRIHCTRLAGSKADLWHLRQCPTVLNLPFRSDIPRPNRDNAIDVYLNDDEWMDVLDEGKWQQFFTERPEPMTKEKKRAWLANFKETALASDAFFPFSDNIERAFRSGVKYIAQPGGSVRDEDVIKACDEHGIAMVFTGLRLFHH
jgi:phosphoribosylaminoimidazolecarboxamide formyltransferase/IMP cyclohydrolase/phosphoribosylaminoimidazolecarboxamide formyltransferase